MSAGRVVLWILRLGLAGVYLFAAIPKVLDPWSFARAIWNFRIVPLGPIPAITLWLPILEGLAAFAVLIGVFRRGGLCILNILSATFAAAIISAMARGLDIDCGCFGHATTSKANISHLALNVTLLAAGIILLVAALRRRRNRHAPVPDLHR